jgi:hypothetical protein
MKLNALHWMFGLAVALPLAGCGQGTSAPVEKMDASVSSTDELKTRVQQIADSGVAGSALAGVQDQINLVSDAAKKEKLQKIYDELSKERDAAKIKALASDMLKEL